jgi:D-alanyl-D-alanine carboxypeptidase (penicillin-binding protein 5/6)
MKTGHTEAAGYCLISSAKRGERRLLSVVLGTASDSRARAGVAQAAQLRLPVLRRRAALCQGPGGLQPQGLEGCVADGQGRLHQRFHLAVPKGFGPKVQAELVSQQPLMAPVALGQTVGTMKVSVDGKLYGEFPVLAIEAVPQAGIIGRAIDSVRLWFN